MKKILTVLLLISVSISYSQTIEQEIKELKKEVKKLNKPKPQTKPTTLYDNAQKKADESEARMLKEADAAGEAIMGKILEVQLDKAIDNCDLYTMKYESNPDVEFAFNIEKNCKKAIKLGATNIKNKWGIVTKDHKLIIMEHKTFKKYKKYLKKNKKN
tara:strand:- start:102 stop:575 length:474 start_codon:yes stop_codon:yes gene_type:complete